jgi:hypothetical protein
MRSLQISIKGDRPWSNVARAMATLDHVSGGGDIAGLFPRSHETVIAKVIDPTMVRPN